ncbi:Monocarboxylate transporter 8 [Eumeta japonica]|uniref:Monocarboxylate transporter 8 n=1 Tax=Eumeta variegata TaxID=151549 RepID=A0A4C1WKV3_EUMVA|nr:Monocarboxylate transporter 8 [Eumeta japonica]
MEINPNINTENQNETRANGRPRRTQELHLDKVVASQPEIGPTPPDGGYGWIVLISATVYNVTVPGLLVMYSLVITNALKIDEDEESEEIRIWDMGLTLVPVLAVVIKLLLESWCRTVVKIFHMPRLLALAGLCPTVAGVLLSSYNTHADDNDDILNIFAAILIGAGWALTTQQTDVIITHYFRKKLTLAQRIVKLAPAVGNCVAPLIVGMLCVKYPNDGDSVVMVYAALLMQNCFFLASYSRPIYIERVLRSTYSTLKDDDDDVIYSRPSTANDERNRQPALSAHGRGPRGQTIGTAVADDVEDHVVIFNSNRNAKEILDPEVQTREYVADVAAQRRFSSDFGAVLYADGADPTRSNRFSSDFTAADIGRGATGGYQELAAIGGAASDPQPLYRATTVDAGPQYGLSFAVEPEAAPGTQRRTASLKKHFITVTNILVDVNFYLYAVLHLSSTFSILVMSLFFAPLVMKENQSMSVWDISMLLAITSVVAVFFMKISAMFSKAVNEKYEICGTLCALGAFGCYGICPSYTMVKNGSLISTRTRAVKMILAQASCDGSDGGKCSKIGKLVLADRRIKLWQIAEELQISKE